MSAIPSKNIALKKGMTLMEIMIVLVIMATIMAMGAYGLGFLGAADVRGDALKLSSSIRYIFNMAATSNATLQMQFDFDNQSFVVEQLDVNGGLSNEELSGATMKAAESGSMYKRPDRVDRLDDEDSKFGKVTRTTVDKLSAWDNDDDDESDTVYKLSDGVYFIGLMTSHHDEIQTEGIGTINFFANGFVERSVIILGDELAKDGSDGATYYSISLNPLTGQSSVTAGYMEISSTFFEEEEDR